MPPSTALLGQYSEKVANLPPLPLQKAVAPAKVLGEYGYAPYQVRPAQQVPKRVGTQFLRLRWGKGRERKEQAKETGWL